MEIGSTEIGNQKREVACTWPIGVRAREPSDHGVLVCRSHTLSETVSERVWLRQTVGITVTIRCQG